MAGAPVEVDWSSLPPHLLSLIANRFLGFIDYLYFVHVCQRWRHAATQPDDHSINRVKLHILRTCHNKLPMLMAQSSTSLDEKSRDLYFLSDRRFPYQIELQNPCFHRRVLRFCLGWLMINDEETNSIILLNPFTRRQVSLPGFIDHDDLYDNEDLVGSHRYFFKKGILSTDPSQDPHFQAVVILDWGDFAVFTNNSWFFFHEGCSFNFADAVYFRGHIYLVTEEGHLFKVDFTHPGRICSKVVTAPLATATKATVAYLVVSTQGLLLMVKQYGGDERQPLWKFEVFVLLTEEGRWCEIKDLGDQALFLGNNQSVCVSTLEFPTCQPNCIYYSLYYDEFSPLHRQPFLRGDLVLFNLQTMTIQSLPTPEPNSGKYTFPPIWIVPNLKEQ